MNTTDWRQIAEAMPQIVWQADAHGDAIYFNQRCYDYTGLTEAEALGFGWTSAIHPDDVEPTKRIWSAALADGVPYEAEYRIREGKTGEYRWFLGRGSPVAGPGGAIVRWIGTCTDVDDYKRLEAAIRENADSFEALAEFVPQLIWVSDANGAIQYVNRRWSDYVGAAREDIITDAGWRFVHPDDRGRVAEAWGAAQKRSERYENEFRLVGRDGTYRWFLVRGQPMTDAAGSVVRWFGTCTDVDAQKRTLQQLAEREAQLRLLNDVVPAIVWTAAPDGTVRTLSKRWFDYTGRPVEESTSASDWAAAVHPDDVAAAVDRYGAGIASGERFVNENRLRGADGIYRWHYTIAEPTRDALGEITSWIGTTHEIQADREARDRLRADLEREHRVSEAFQLASLPERMPEIPSIAIDTVYRAAASDAFVGGDWYDAFEVAGGLVVVCVGDVMGKGLSAAVTMNAVRRSIRGTAQVLQDPAGILDAVDASLDDVADVMATAFLGVFDPRTLELRYASAGHPPPLVRARSGAVTDLAGSGLPIGYRRSGKVDVSRTADLSGSALVVLYTDGITESTRNPVEGERRLRAVVGGDRVLDADDPARFIASALLEDPPDDVAILTMRILRNPAVPSERSAVLTYHS